MTTLTHCPYCSLQCAMAVSTVGGSFTISPVENQSSLGGLCKKGWTALDALENSVRLITPMCRDSKSSPLRECTWGEAYQIIIERIQFFQSTFGADSIGVFGGGGLTNEKAYYLGKFARVVLGTRLIDYNGRFCMSSAAAALNRSFGLDRGLPFQLKDISKAEVVLLAGSNMAVTMPPATRYLKEMVDRGGQLIVVDPRKTPTAKLATIHLQPVPGTDLALANGLLHLAIVKGYLDIEFISEKVRNFSEVRETVMSYWPERVERITGISIADLHSVADLLGRSGTAAILTGRGAEQHSSGTDTVSAYLNLATVMGKVGKPGSGFGTLTGQGNGQGGREHGQKADQLPGYRSISNLKHRQEMAAFWGIEEEQLPSAGVSAQDLFSGTSGTDLLKCLIVMGSNPVISAADSNSIERRLKGLDLLVVVDPFLSETAEIADVVLPSAQWAEETGTMTNLEGRVILRNAFKSPPNNVKTDLEIIRDFADRLGWGSKFSADPEEVFTELARATKGGKADYSGISYKKITSAGGVQWPCSDLSPDGTEQPFVNGFDTPDSKVHMYSVEFTGPDEVTSQESPIYLVTGRTLLQYQSGTQTRRIGALIDDSDPYLEIHPVLAERFGISHGDTVEVSSQRGRAAFKAKLTNDIRTDTVFASFHWPGMSRANLLTNPVLDPISKMPEFKVCVVSLSSGLPVEGKFR